MGTVILLITTLFALMYMILYKLILYLFFFLSTSGFGNYRIKNTWNVFKSLKCIYQT